MKLLCEQRLTRAQQILKIELAADSKNHGLLRRGVQPQRPVVEPRVKLRLAVLGPEAIQLVQRGLLKPQISRDDAAKVAKKLRQLDVLLAGFDGYGYAAAEEWPRVRAEDFLVRFIDQLLDLLV
jgi:hypothetical protein